MSTRSLRCVLCVLAILTLSAWVQAEKKPDRTQFNRDLRVDEGESVGEVTCVHCSIYIRGQVAGDATAINGRIILEQDAVVSGDATSILGDVRLASGARVAGDATAIGGSVLRDQQASVGGDVTTMAGGGWILLIFLVPLLVLGGIIALIVALVHYGRRPVQVPVRSS
ncbi:MAG: hypothetical protein LAO03_18230 [Acidobacteriia bacterium]|nr:hypothetical protein [Terriglobia bacterium]